LLNKTWETLGGRDWLWGKKNTDLKIGAKKPPSRTSGGGLSRKEGREIRRKRDYRIIKTIQRKEKRPSVKKPTCEKGKTPCPENQKKNQRGGTTEGSYTVAYRGSLSRRGIPLRDEEEVGRRG